MYSFCGNYMRKYGTYIMDYIWSKNNQVKVGNWKKNIAQVVYQVHDMKYHVRKKETPSMISKIPKHAKNISPCV